jgi:hypothetical protein
MSVINFMINVWLSVNCIGRQLGTVIVGQDQCVEPMFGLAFRANGTHASVTDRCSQTKYINTVRCEANGDCCLVPETLSINITETYLNTTPNATRPNSMTGLPEPKSGRVFVCTEQLVGN